MGGWTRASSASIATPVLLVVAFLLGEWLIWSVSLHDALLFVGYELGFNLLPGVLAYMALTRRVALGLEQLAVGWALGYALELGAFAATASTGHRSLFPLYPVVVGVVTIPFIALRLRRGDGESIPRRASRWMWALALVMIVVLGYFGEQSFATSPPPQSVPEIQYHQDQVLFVSLAAEARHHWPLQDPQLAGTPLHYHYFLFLHEAAVNQVTGISLFNEEFRLCLPLLALLVLLQFGYAGRVFAGRTGAGVVAGAIFFLVSNFDPLPSVPADLFPIVYLSGTFLFGMAFFLPAVTELGRILAPEAERDRRPAHWLVLLILLAAAAGAKGSILPIVVGALVLLGGYALVRDRKLLPRLAGLGIGVAVLLWAARRTLYQHTIGDLVVKPGYILERDLPVILIVLAFLSLFALRYVRKLWQRLAVAGAFIGLFVFAAEAPAIWPHKGKTFGFDPIEWGIIGREQPFRYLHQFIPHSTPLLGAFWILAVVLGTLKLLEILLPGLIGVWVSRRDGNPRLWLLLIALLVMSLIPLYAFVLAGDAQAYFFVYGYAAGCVLAGAGIVALWRRYVRVRLRPSTVVALVLLLFVLWAIDRPLDATPKKFWEVLTSQTAVPGCCNRNMTPALYAGLSWLERHSSPDDVLAVNNQFQDAAGLDSRYYYYSAFSERRVMLGGTFTGGSVGPFYPPESVARKNPALTPFPEQVRINNAIFYKGKISAVHKAQRSYGVRYLLADKFHGATKSELRRVSRLGTVVFDNPALRVISVKKLQNSEQGRFR